jgi:hypothetical protein
MEHDSYVLACGKRNGEWLMQIRGPRFQALVPQGSVILQA